MEKNSMDDDTGKRVFIELGTHLQVEISDTNMFLGSELIGMEVGRYLIIKIHGEDREALNNKDIFVKYFHIDSILGFHSTVISLISIPDYLAFITYPQTVENFNLRANQRPVCFMPAKLEIEHNLVEGVITDINEGGCCFEVNNFRIMDERPVGRVTLWFPQNMMKSELRLQGEVKSIRHMKDDMKIGIGFDKMDAYTHMVVQNVLPILDFHSVCDFT